MARAIVAKRERGAGAGARRQNMSAIGERLGWKVARLRRAAGLQAELAERIGAQPEHISQIETGRRGVSCPSTPRHWSEVCRAKGEVRDRQRRRRDAAQGRAEGEGRLPDDRHRDRVKDDAAVDPGVRVQREAVEERAATPPLLEPRPFPHSHASAPTRLPASFAAPAPPPSPTHLCCAAPVPPAVQTSAQPLAGPGVPFAGATRMLHAAQVGRHHRVFSTGSCRP